MEDLALNLFISIAVPLSMMLLIFEKRSKKVLLFLIIGLFVALFAGELNGVLLEIPSSLSEHYYYDNISPTIEELLKAIPILLFALLLKPGKQTLIECSVSVGVGFAILENAVIFANAAGSIRFDTALIRGFGTGILHGLTCLILGWGIAAIGSEKKLLLSGIVALLNLTTIFHAVYNALALSGYPIIGFLLPVCVFIPFLIFGIKTRRKAASDMQNPIQN